MLYVEILLQSPYVYMVLGITCLNLKTILHTLSVSGKKASHSDQLRIFKVHQAFQVNPKPLNPKPL